MKDAARYEKGQQFKEGRYVIVKNLVLDSKEKPCRVDLVFDVINNAK